MPASARTADSRLAVPVTGPRVGAVAVGDDEIAAPSFPVSLWVRRDVVQLVVLCGVAAALMGTAWFASGDGRPLERQVPLIDLAAGGLLIELFAGGLFLLGGLRAVAARRATVKELTAARIAARPCTPFAAGGELVAGAGMTRYHRPGCSLVARKPVAAASRSEHERAGRRPCGMCLRAAPLNVAGGRS